jgi:two-component system NtrC family response regulator
VEAAKKYPWPGNVRELISAIERSIAAASAEPTLFPAHLPTYIRADIARAAATDRPEQGDRTKEQAAKIARSLPTMQKTREKAIREAEKKYLQDLMQTVGKDIAEACKLSGLSRSRLYALLKKHSIPLS